jgi:hypothetical protein
MATLSYRALDQGEPSGITPVIDVVQYVPRYQSRPRATDIRAQDALPRFLHQDPVRRETIPSVQVQPLTSLLSSKEQDSL